MYRGNSPTRRADLREPTRPTLVLGGALAAAAQLASGELLAALLPGARSPIAGVGRALIDRTPGPVVDVTVALVEGGDKPLLLAGIVSTALGVGALVAPLARSRFLAGASCLAVGGALAGFAAATRPDAATLPSLAAGLGGGVAGVTALRALSSEPRRRAAGPVLLATAGGAWLARQFRRQRQASHRVARARVRLPEAAHRLGQPPTAAPFPVPGLSPSLTPSAAFYVTDVTFPHPTVDPAGWHLRVDGLVERELALTLDELLALPTVELDATLVCVHNPVGGGRIGAARWQGVPVAALLERAGMLPGATHCLARSIDGFAARVPLDALDRTRPALVAVGMNGAPLTVEHGFPARLLVPGIFGYAANTKWLAALSLADAAAEGYWGGRGWPGSAAAVQTQSRIDVPRDRALIAAGMVTIAGVAWDIPGGVRGVEVCFGDGPWHQARLADSLAPTAWRHWRYDWQAVPGTHTIRVRAHGARGVQEGRDAPPFPHGATGYHAITVTVPPPGTSPGGAWRAAVAARAADAGRRVELAGRGVAAWRRHRALPPASLGVGRS